jgi:hypothetical protein
MSLKLECLPEGSPDCPLVRLFDYRRQEAVGLFRAVTELAAGDCELIVVHEFPGVQPIGNCRLTFLIRWWDQAMIAKSPGEFECGFTRGSWGNVAALIEPLASGAAGFQWLAGVPGEARLLLSPDGRW